MMLIKNQPFSSDELGPFLGDVDNGFFFTPFAEHAIRHTIDDRENRYKRGEDGSDAKMKERFKIHVLTITAGTLLEIENLKLPYFDPRRVRCEEDVRITSQAAEMYVASPKANVESFANILVKLTEYYTQLIKRLRDEMDGIRPEAKPLTVFPWQIINSSQQETVL